MTSHPPDRRSAIKAYVEPEVADRVDALVARTGETRSSFLRRLVMTAISDQPALPVGARYMSEPMMAAVGAAGRLRHAVASDRYSTRDLAALGAETDRLTQAAGKRGGNRRRGNPRPSVRPTRARSGAGDAMALDDVLDGLRAGLHAVRDGRAAPQPELDDYDLEVIQEGLLILAGRDPVSDASGNVRGCRRRPDGTVERF